MHSAPDRDDTVTSPVILAADVGGTRSRFLVAPLDPQAPPLMDSPVLGPGANLRSSGPGALQSLAGPAREALATAGVTGDQVRAAVLGIAGNGAARRQEISHAVAETLAPLGITPDALHATDDHLTAFLSADVGEDGLLLLAGTGSVSVRFEHRRPVQRCDGMGWLLGDVGSAVWLGRAVLQAVAADIDGRGPRTRLTESLGDVLGLDLRDGLVPRSATGDPRQDLVAAIDGLSPAELGRFAPLPGSLCEDAPDEVAREILDHAGRHFSRTVQRLDPEAGLPVVLAGGVLSTRGPIHDDLVSWLETAGRTVVPVDDGLDGAVRLARERSPR
ncbi:N-acetylglucosamine kinase [Brachybacterium endophyticum]|uniref:N-acetylglucosamine kinase n=1 Tax=Brachybacterium endophyticum TaxID=2182385 RepID=UPI001F0BF53C|nr:BadF/BadG/BcrA/BcrD ATPase family protein [Brachybacterium endophyticum]